MKILNTVIHLLTLLFYPFRDKLTLAVLKLRESGDLEDMQKQWWEKMSECPLQDSAGVMYQDIVAHNKGAQWLSDRVLDSRPRGRGLEPRQRHYVVFLEQDTFILA